MYGSHCPTLCQKHVGRSLAWIYEHRIYCEIIFPHREQALISIKDIVLPGILSLIHSGLLCLSTADIVENIVPHYPCSIAEPRVVDLRRPVSVNIKDIVIHFAPWVPGKDEQALQIILADVITESSIVCLAPAEHNTSAAIVMAVIVLVNSPIRIINIPWHPILVIYSIKCLIILEDPVLAFPRPDPCADIPIITGISSVCCIHICATAVCNIILHQGTERIHCNNSVISDIFNIVIFKNDIGMAILLGCLVCNSRPVKLRMLISKPYADSRPGYVPDIAV